MLFRYAEENYDRKYPNSLGLLWTITFDPGEGIDRCRWDVDYLEHGTATEEHLEEATPEGRGTSPKVHPGTWRSHHLGRRCPRRSSCSILEGSCAILETSCSFL